MGIQEEAKEIIQEIFGPSTARKVDDFAKDFPPDTQGRLFLDKCRALVVKFINEEAAEEKFKSLYARVK